MGMFSYHLLKRTILGSRYFSQLVNENLIVKHLEDKPGIVEIALNRPVSKNAFSKSLLREFKNAIADIHADNNNRVVILRSLVPGVFSSGADLKERAKFTEPEVIEFVSSLRQAFQDLSNINPPVIAVIDGVALGGGLELALACDIRIASLNSKLGLVETKLGIIPGAGGTQRLPRIINPSLAKELIFTARVLSGQEACNIGLVNYAVESNEVYNKALEIAEKIVQNGPIAVKFAKMAINDGMQADLETGLRIEENLYGKIVPTKDRVEGLTAFRDKRVPQYVGE